MKQEAGGGIQSVERSFALLEWLAAQPQGGNIKEMSGALSLPKSTVHRLVQNLVGMGYVFQPEAAGRYRLTLKLFEISSGVGGQADVAVFAKPHLDSLAQQTGETVHLVVRDDKDIIYIYKAESIAKSSGMQLSSRIGLRKPAFCTAVGKAIFSTLPHVEARRVWQQSEIVQFTPKTITDFSQMEKQLGEAKRRGWALDDEENEIGIRCVAVPLAAAGRNGEAEAAFSVSALAARMDESRIEQIAKFCLDVQKDILRDMGIGR